MPKGATTDVTGAEEGSVRSRAQQLYDLAQTVVAEYGARDTMLENLEPYYFLDGDQDPDQESDEDNEADEHLQVVRLPHGTDVVDLIQSLLSGSELHIAVPARSELKRDLDLADNAEQFLAALLEENDRTAGQPILERAAWLVAMRAAFCARVVFIESHLEKNEGTGVYMQGNRPALLFQVRDPLVVYPKFGEDGLLYVVEQWTRTVADIRYTWGEDLLEDLDPDDEVEWCEIWTREEFCYWANGELISKDVEGSPTPGPWEHGYGGIPYVWRFAQQTGVREPERRPRPLLESQRYVIDGMNMLDTVELTTVAEYGGDSLIVETREDNFELDLSPLAVNYVKPGEKIYWLRTGRRPLEAASSRAKYESSFQRGTFAYSMYGQDPGRMMSGFSLSLLNQGGQMKLRPIIRAIEEGVADLLSTALMMCETQLAPLLDGGIVKAYTRGTHTSSEGQSRTVRQEVALKAKDLAGYYDVDVSLGEVLPQDKQGNVVMAQRTQQPGPNGRPLLSWRTAVETFKLVDSPAEERRRIDEEMVANDPEVQALRRAIFAAKVRQELVEEAEELDIDVDQVLAGAEPAAPPPLPEEEELMAGLPGEMLPAAMQGPMQGAPMGPEGMPPMGPGMPPMV